MADATGPRRASPLLEFTAAVIFLTRLPIPWRGHWPADLGERAFAWFPIVGGLIGAVGGVAYWGLFTVGLPPWLAAAGTVMALAWLTGGRLESGLARMADALSGRAWATDGVEHGRIGVAGAGAVVLSFALRIGVLAVLADPRMVALTLIGAHAFSRGLLPALKAALPDAGATGASMAPGRPNGARALVAAVIGISLAATALGKLDPLSGIAGLLVMAASAATVWSIAALARRRPGDIAGATAGAAQQVSEVAFLLTLVAALGPVAA